MIIIQVDFKVTAFSNFFGVADGFRTIPETVFHFLRGFKVEGVGGKAEMLGVVDGLACLDTEQYLMGMGIFLVQVVAVVGGHKLDVQFCSQFFQTFIDYLLFRNGVVLEFEIQTVSKDF